LHSVARKVLPAVAAVAMGMVAVVLVAVALGAAAVVAVVVVVAAAMLASLLRVFSAQYVSRSRGVLMWGRAHWMG
jgi:hypothetical protein